MLFFKDLIGPRCFEYTEGGTSYNMGVSTSAKSRGPSLRQKRDEQKNTPNSLIPGQIIIFHQPRFPWIKGISLTKPPFGVRSCEVAIIWPELIFGHGKKLRPRAPFCTDMTWCLPTNRFYRNEMHRFRYQKWRNPVPYKNVLGGGGSLTYTLTYCLHMWVPPS